MWFLATIFGGEICFVNTQLHACGKSSSRSAEQAEVSLCPCPADMFFLNNHDIRMLSLLVVKIALVP